MNNINVVLIVADTLRKDVLPLYGGNANTPSINSFANDAVVYQKAISPASWTLPSHASFFTGLYAREHGIHEEYDEMLKNINEKQKNFQGKTIFEKLKESGYNTIGFSENPMIIPGSMFDRGFNTFTFIDFEYMTPEDRNVREEIFKNYGKKNASEIIRKLVLKGKFSDLMKLISIYRRININRKLGNFPAVKGANKLMEILNSSSFDAPFSMFINFMEPHEPYVKWEIKNTNAYMSDLFGTRRIPENIMNMIRLGYMNSASYFDMYFGQFIKYLKETGQYDRSLIILTSDHGQALKEKIFYGHGIFLYDELIEVPLLIKYPNGFKPEVKDGYQSLVSIPELIMNVVDSNYEFNISQDVVFSESFGFHATPDVFREMGIDDRDKIESLKSKFLYPRKAVFKNGYKMVVNGLNGEIEEFTFNKKMVSPSENKEIVKGMLDELYIFKGNEKFVLPKF